jgi:hypothetical protein
VEAAVKLEIGCPDDGVARVAVRGHMRGDDGDVLAFALQAIPAHLEVVVDLSAVAGVDARCEREVRAALQLLDARSPVATVIPLPGGAPVRARSAVAPAR